MDMRLVACGAAASPSLVPTVGKEMTYRISYDDSLATAVDAELSGCQ